MRPRAEPSLAVATVVVAVVLGSSASAQFLRRDSHATENVARVHEGAPREPVVTSGVGTPTICAVGPIGSKAHTPDEYLVVDSLAADKYAVSYMWLKDVPAGRRLKILRVLWIE